MSYLVLARKWRPQAFADVAGQQAVVRTLQNALKRNRVAHAMLFSGVRGVGKTTLARLMAKALNCQQGEPEVPCNECDSCKEIMAGSAIDLTEIDGASNRGIQEIRELKENIRFFPTKSKYKIIIIDEVHMLTTEAFNALLKTLEEPPAHVYFMFATTELHKIPITILSRCQRYELKRVAFNELNAFFAKIAAQEEVNISERALSMIAREAEGSVRDGLSLLDQIFSFGGETISDEDVVQVLGLVDRSVFENLARALLAGDLAGCLDIFDKAYSVGIDLKRFAHDLLTYFRSLLIVKTAKEPGTLLDVSDQELVTLKEIADGTSQESLYQFFHLLMKGVGEMQYAARPRMVLEMAFMRASQAGELVPMTSLLGKVDQLLAGVVPEELAAPVAVPAPAQPLPTPQSPPAVTPEVPAEKKTVESAATPEPVEYSIPEEPPAPALSEPEPELEPEPVVVTPAVASREVRKNWDGFISYVKDRKPWMSHVLRLCSSAREEGMELVLRFDDLSDCKVLQDQDNHKLLTEFAQDFFQHDFKVVLNVRGNATEGGDEEDGESPLDERRALANDPLVQVATEIFSARVDSIRTGPRSR